MSFLDFIFPKRCVGCGKIGNYFCDRCSASVRIIKSNEAICPVCEKPAIDGVTHPGCKTRFSIDGLTSFFRYDAVVKKAIKVLKYRFVSDVSQEFISLVPSWFFTIPYPLTTTHCALVPVPLHVSRLRERGFNQAEVLGTCLAKRLGISIRTDALRRVNRTTPQVEMHDRNKRLKNIKGAFVITNSFDKILIDHQNVKKTGRIILLFDDVFTTGATMRDAASVLKHHGVQCVWGVTMAR
jgi:competence protein ComFC